MSRRPLRAARRQLRSAAAAALLALAILPATAAAGVAEPENLNAARATQIADRDPKVVEERRLNPGLISSASFDESRWEVGYFAHGDEVALVIVDDTTGLVSESWTGEQVAWKMARGYEGAFGHKLNAPYVFLPLCALFLIGLLDWRRPWRIASLDLLVLLGFGISNYFFNRAEIGVSVPLQYPPLLYLLARCLWIGFRGRGSGLTPVWPATWLIVAALFLVGFRVGLNVADSGVVDVGYAGVVGADRMVDGDPLYGRFPEDVSQGDTYGPVNYLAYVPFEQVWPWSGSWDDLPAAHAAAIFFDLGTFALLMLLGLRLRAGPEGRMLAATLGFGWAAYPYTAYVLESNSNDTLVALLLVATLLVLARPVARGTMLALATWTKFAPAILLPMLATYRPLAAGGADLGDRPEHPPGAQGWWHQIRDRTRGPVAFGAAFVVVSAALMAWPAVDPGLGTFWDRTIAYQAGRDSPFSIWGQLPGLEPLRWVIIAATGLLAVGLALRPRRKSAAQVAALGAALLIAVQLTAEHWFYLYIVWFFPLLLVGLAAIRPGPEAGPARSTPPGRRDQQSPQPPSPRRPPLPSRSEPASV